MGHIHAFIPACLTHFEFSHEHDFWSGDPAFKDMHLEYPHEQHSNVADEEMVFDAVYFLQEYRSCIDI